MDQRIVEQLRYLNKYLLELKGIRHDYPLQEFLNNSMIQAATERYLQLSIESCINIGNRIIAMEQVMSLRYVYLFICCSQVERGSGLYRKLQECLFVELLICLLSGRRGC
jgi:hypothetical protein